MASTSSFVTICFFTVVAVVATSDGYFFYGGSSRKTNSEYRNSDYRSSERSQQVPPPQYTGYRMEQPWSQQYYDSPVPPMTVAVPLAVPVPAQMSPVSSGPIRGQPVQLVPCLCPISREDPQQQSQQQGFVISTLAQQQQQQPQQQQQHQQQQHQQQQQQGAQAV